MSAQRPSTLDELVDEAVKIHHPALPPDATDMFGLMLQLGVTR
jgi:hypothetical protein